MNTFLFSATMVKHSSALLMLNLSICISPVLKYQVYGGICQIFKSNTAVSVF